MQATKALETKVKDIAEQGMWRTLCSDLQETCREGPSSSPSYFSKGVGGGWWWEWWWCRRAGPSLLSAVFLQPLQLGDVGTPVSIGPQSQNGASDLLECPHSCPQGMLGLAERGSEEAQEKSRPLLVNPLRVEG